MDSEASAALPVGVTSTGEPSSDVNTSTFAGRITPEQPSDITSSDAVTIHSSSGISAINSYADAVYN